jgi:hypothetical protein
MRTAAVFVFVCALGALTYGCFQAEESACMFKCDPAGAALCPDGYECLNDGYCHQQGSTEACGYPNQDAAVVQQDAAPATSDAGGGT